MVIGGAEDRVRDKGILSRFSKFAGGEGGHVGVISPASSLGDEATNAYRELFLGVGVGRVTGQRPAARGGVARCLHVPARPLPARRRCPTGGKPRRPAIFMLGELGLVPGTAIGGCGCCRGLWT